MPDESNPVERLLQIDLPLSVVVAEKIVNLGEVLEFRIGTLLTFETRVEEMLQLRVHERTIARGEAVKVGGHFGLHVHEVDDAKERIQSMGPRTE